MLKDLPTKEERKEECEKINNILNGISEIWCEEWECYVYPEDEIRDLIKSILRNKDKEIYFKEVKK